MKSPASKTAPARKAQQYAAPLPHECPYCGEDLRPQESTDGTNEQLRGRIRTLEQHVAQLLGDARREQEQHETRLLHQTQHFNNRIDQMYAECVRRVDSAHAGALEENIMLQAIMSKYGVNFEDLPAIKQEYTLHASGLNPLKSLATAPPSTPPPPAAAPRGNAGAVAARCHRAHDWGCEGCGSEEHTCTDCPLEQ